MQNYEQLLIRCCPSELLSNEKGKLTINQQLTLAKANGCSQDARGLLCISFLCSHDKQGPEGSEGDRKGVECVDATANAPVANLLL